MDLDGIIRDLINERNRLDRIIRALEQQDLDDDSGERPRSRRGRKSMDSEARRQVSERMKQYWARQRELRKADGSDSAGQSGEDLKIGWGCQDAGVSLAGPDCGERVTHASSGSIQ